MKTISKLILASVLILTTIKVSAMQGDLNRFTIDESSIMIEEIAEDSSYNSERADSSDNPFDIIKKIVNTASKIFKIIEENRPVVNIATNYANAVPQGVAHWTQLTGWKGPNSKTYKFSARNAVGIKVVKMTYKVHYIWGGSFKGKGKFLTGVTIEPKSIETAWGCNLDMTAEVPDSSVGNAGTSENPVASMEIHLKWKVKTFTRDIEKTAVYRVQGDGLLQGTGELFKRGLEAETADKIDAITEQIKSLKFD
ncbi:MAG: hypothetical protein L6420_02965 [Elusimicrobia bacterium]|nr:hypothetical protein [Elusimicrobiota bacterium]